jgi:hypothetical protein
VVNDEMSVAGLKADGAEAKLIAQVVDQLNAANQKLAISQPNRGITSNPGSEQMTRNQFSNMPSELPRAENSKTLVFDPIPARCAEFSSFRLPDKRTLDARLCLAFG